MGSRRRRRMTRMQVPHTERESFMSVSCYIQRQKEIRTGQIKNGSSTTAVSASESAEESAEVNNTIEYTRPFIRAGARV